MSEVEFFSDLTPLVEADPFALLGISVSADEKQLTKRYRQIAKQLHPDILASADPSQGMERAIAAQVIARIVNPAHQKLKHEKSRQQTLTLLRLRVRRLARSKKLVPTFASGQQLLETAASEVDIFYEQTVSQLAHSQFQSPGHLREHSLEISQLNLIFLYRKVENSVIHTRRSGLVVAAATPTAVFPSSPTAADAPAVLPVAVDYVQKHINRAQTYLIQQNYSLAVQELREALKITPQSAELHSMIGQAYYKLNLLGMAKTHFRQALKLKPTHKVAQKYGELLGITATEVSKKHWLSKLVSH